MRVPAEQLADVTGGRWIGGHPVADGVIAAVTDDSRHVRNGVLFIAIHGEITDGHRYVVQAAEAGAAAVCVERTCESYALGLLREHGTPTLVVDDTLAAFHAIARAHRRSLPDIPIVALTGSNGKTSTKEMIASILERRWPGAALKTEGNTNNHFGVPRNLLRLSDDHRAAVIELGTNHPGEIAQLVHMVEPTIGLVSNIGGAHLGALGDLAGVAREKGSLLAGVAEDGVAIIPADAPHVDILRCLAGTRQTMTFGTGADTDLCFRYHGWVDGQCRFDLHWQDTALTRTIAWSTGGAHQASNAAAAAAVGTVLGLSADAIVEGLETCRLPRMRTDLREVDGAHWAVDAYNANPDSARAGLDWFAELVTQANARDVMVVLGDMLELGPDSAGQHARLLAVAGSALPDADIVAVGSLMSEAAAACGLRSFANSDAARQYIVGRVRPGTWVYLKGSRGVRLEKILPDAATQP